MDVMTVWLRGQEAAQKLQKEPEPPKETVAGLGCKDRRAAIFGSLAMYISRPEAASA